jgi:alpha-beta hydrolase superfamily lysophospholipase
VPDMSISPMADLHSMLGILVIFYDQVGCGRSRPLRSKAGHLLEVKMDVDN